MRENRLSGSEGGAILIQSSLPLSIDLSLRDGRAPFFNSLVGRSLGQMLFSAFFLTKRVRDRVVRSRLRLIWTKSVELLKMRLIMENMGEGSRRP